MKRILVPCDFSAPAREAFKLATNIAAQNNGEVILLYIINIPVIYDAGQGGILYTDPTFLDSIQADAKKNFEEMISSTQSRAKVSYTIEQGDVLYVIKQVAEQKDVDLIIMGTHGAAGWNEVLIGSNTEKVVRHSPVPVLAIRTAPAGGGFKKILLPSTLTLDQTEFMSKVKKMQEFFHATLHILLVNTPAHFRTDAEAKGALEEFVKHYKLKDYELHFRNYKSEEEGIISFAQTEGVDLVAMATHARKGLAHLFNGSIAEDVVNHITFPVWTYALK